MGECVQYLHLSHRWTLLISLLLYSIYFVIDSEHTITYKVIYLIHKLWFLLLWRINHNSFTCAFHPSSFCVGRPTARKNHNTNIRPLHSVEIQIKTFLCNGMIKSVQNLLLSTPVLSVWINTRPRKAITHVTIKMCKVIHFVTFIFEKRYNILLI